LTMLIPYFSQYTNIFMSDPAVFIGLGNTVRFAARRAEAR
jgi:hypothetical protein